MMTHRHSPSAEAYGPQCSRLTRGGAVTPPSRHFLAQLRRLFRVELMTGFTCEAAPSQRLRGNSPHCSYESTSSAAPL